MTDDTPYSKRELDYRFDEITDHLRKQDLSLDKILIQTTKTNGRVSKLEQWRSVLIWGFGTLIVVITGIIRFKLNI